MESVPLWLDQTFWQFRRIGCPQVGRQVPTSHKGGRRASLHYRSDSVSLGLYLGLGKFCWAILNKITQMSPKNLDSRLLKDREICNTGLTLLLGAEAGTEWRSSAVHKPTSLPVTTAHTCSLLVAWGTCPALRHWSLQPLAQNPNIFVITRSAFYSCTNC